MSSDSHSADELEVRLRRACAELDRRVREGETNVAQEVLASEPEFASNENLAIELIYTEFVTLEELGADPSPYETLARFPQWRSRLERLLKVHDAFRGDAEVDLEQSSETLTGIDSTGDGNPLRKTAANGLSLRRIAQYELLEEIDRGGMGIVYKARQIGLNRIVAIKSIRSADASDLERSRFRAEAESAAKLQHANIVQVYDVGEHDGLDFLSMEYIPGGSLEKRMVDGDFSIHASAQLLATIAEAIHFAHQRGIVHRDLKPGNILLDNDVPKIVDFGLAKRMLERLDAQTQTGAVLGTPCYMSPEQAEGRSEAVGPPADIYALGAILYEMLTGRPPFVGESPLTTIDMIRQREPEPPSSLVPNVPRDLDTICLKCLSKETSRRYGSAQELADDLNRFLDHQPIQARRVGFLERSWRWACRRPAISGLALTLLIVSLAGSLVVAWQQRHVGELSKSANATERRAAVIEQRAEAAAAEAGDNLQAAKQAIERLSLLGSTLHRQPGMGATARRAVEQALHQYQELLEKYGDDHAVRWEAARGFDRAGFIQYELGQWISAEKTFAQGVEVYDTLNDDPRVDYGRAGIRIQLAHCQRNLGKWKDSEDSYDAAIALLERLRQAHPTNNAYALRLANTLVNLCIVLKHEGRLDMAEQAYCRAIRLERRVIERTAGFESAQSAENHVEGANELARNEILAAKALRGRVVDGGQGILSAVIRGGHFSELAISLDELGMLLWTKGSTELAEIAILEALQLRKLDVRQTQDEDWRQFFLARSHTHVGRLESAKKDYEREAKAHEAAIRILEKLSQDFPYRVPYHSRLGAAYTELGCALQSCQRYEEALVNHRLAVTIHERLVSHDPTLQPLKNDLARSVYQMGRALRRTNQLHQALQHYMRSTELDPEYGPPANALAWRLLMDPDHSIRDPQQALPLAQRAVDLAPQSAAYWNTLGVAHYRNGDDAQAILALMRSVELQDGGGGLDWFFLAMAHARQGDKRVASEWFERARSWCLTQNPLSDELRRTQAEAAEAIER